LEIHKLNASIRTSSGKGVARTLRREGKLPAVLYGSDIESVSLAVDTHDIELLLNKISYSQALINLKVDNGQSFEKMVMIKEIQADPITQNYLHLDFYEVRMDQKITTTVPVEITGVSKGVDAGGTLQIIRRELDVVCLPSQIPDSIVIDISELDMGDSIHVEDIRPEGDLEIPFDVNFTVVTVVSPKAVSGEAAEEAGEEAEVSGEASTEAGEETE
jgi:large subunit ribosomal protein L25